MNFNNVIISSVFGNAISVFASFGFFDKPTWGCFLSFSFLFSLLILIVLILNDIYNVFKK